MTTSTSPVCGLCGASPSACSQAAAARAVVHVLDQVQHQVQDAAAFAGFEVSERSPPRSVDVHRQGSALAIAPGSMTARAAARIGTGVVPLMFAGVVGDVGLFLPP